MTADTHFFFMTGDAAEEAGHFVAAKRAFERGAALGDAACWQRLGLLHDTGVGVEVNKREAMRCYRQAWRQKCTGSANNIAILYREIGNHRAMFRWFQRCAGEGDGSACLELAKCYRDGVGVRKSPEMAVRNLQAALASRFISEYDRGEAQAMMTDVSLRRV